MKIQVSKTMANFINKMNKAGELKIDHAKVKTFHELGYMMNVGDTWEAEQHGDMDYDDEGEYIYKCIMVVYPYDYYAMPKYITTAELTKEAKRRRVTTEEELKQMLKYIIEI